METLDKLTRPYPPLQIESLDSDFGDGLKLVSLLQQLAGKSIGARVTKRPRIRAQKLENVKICFDFMNREGKAVLNNCVVGVQLLNLIICLVFLE